MEATSEKKDQQVNQYFLRYLREKSELTPEEITEEVGVEIELVQHWETGRRQPTQKQLVTLEKLFSIKAGTLTLDIKQLIIQDFNAAYFGDTDARSRLEWRMTKEN